jgi:hypothetical protein
MECRRKGTSKLMSWHYEKLNEVQCKSGKENKLERHT